MKAIMLAAPSSGSGKTTLTMAIIRVLKNRGLEPTCFKTGPDYIDTAFLAAASGRTAGNLDLHLQGRAGLRQALALAEDGLTVIEGAMGYFDGIANTWVNSSYDISRELGVPTVLVYSPRGEMFSAVPKIKGMADFAGSLIKAVILNSVSPKSYLMLKEAIEKNISLPVIGFMPEIKELKLKSRHLGLVQSMEIEHLNEQIEALAGEAEKTIDFEILLDIFTPIESKPFPVLPKRELTVAIARDKAFSFYYRENLKLFEQCCRVIYFSPLTDQNLPECDLLYLGGGYPQVFRGELNLNKTMRDQILNFAFDGGCVYAECGGMLYLCDTVDGTELAGVLKGESKLSDRLQRFGYIDITIVDDCLLGQAGSKLAAHEFHRSESVIDAPACYRIDKTMGSKQWNCGYRFKNVLAGYPHINFLGCLEAFEHMLDYVEKVKFRRTIKIL
jgi:cobyrinic acid a,c-diamide synthase